ncbi:MAG: ATP-binding protein [Bacteroidota bacterium]|nr:ATP-binding protein [Bacteroidota bacterium]
MQTFSREDLVLSELFDALPECVIFFKPLVFNQHISDFEIAFCNTAAGAFLNVPKQVVLSQTILTTSLFEDNYKKTLFRQCLQVWETGKSQEDGCYSKSLDKHFTIVKRKINNGVISITRDRTDHFVAEEASQQQTALFTSILDASADGVMILEAIKTEAGVVTDFRLTHCNKAAFALAKISPASIGKTMLEILPHLESSEQLIAHKKVIDTGQPERLETTFRDENGKEYGWFIVSLMKMGDNVVSTFIDISKEKLDQEKIEEQARLLDGIFEASLNGIFACEAIRNEDGRITDLQLVKINKAFTSIIGISAEVAEGASYDTIFPNGREFGMFDLYCEVIETGKNLRKEIFYNAEKFGGWFDVSASKRDNNGIVITFANVTESKLNKQAIEDGSKYLQDVIDSSQTGILLLSPVRDTAGEVIDFRFRIANETLAGFTGVKAADLAGRLYTKVITEGVSDALFKRYKTIAEGEEAQARFEIPYHVAGTDTWLDVLVKKRNEELLITFLDITAIKRLQGEIAAAAEKLNTIVNHASAGMFTLSPVFNAEGQIDDFRFAIVNQAVATYIGEKAEHLTGALGSVYFPAYKTNGLFKIYEDTYCNKAEHHFDFHYQDGYDVYFNIHTVKAGDEVLVTFTDHTTLKKLQVQLEASIEELKKSNASLEEFAYAASHDLQEPLRKINYFSERLRKGIGQALSADETRMFERMENAASRMSQLITDLLTYSQISRNTHTPETCNLDYIIQQVLIDLETTITIKKAVITTGSLPAIKGDPLQLRQMFQNLLSNSLKYNKADVSPEILIECEEVEKETNGQLNIYYQITITDNGIGFEQENAEKIFKVFQRLHGQSEFPGTGIGLAIVQKVVENHHGFIKAEGRPAIGSVFTILLPKL